MSSDKAGNPVPLLEMMFAYQKTAILKAALELGIFDQLAGGPSAAEDIAGALSLDSRAARVLLNAMIVTGLLERPEPGSYRLSGLSSRFLVRGRAGYLGNMINVLASSWEWQAMSRLADAVRKGGSVAEENAETPGFEYWQIFAEHAQDAAAPVAAAAAELLLPWASGRPGLNILDLACGSGLYGFAFAQRLAHAQIWSLDWPNVLEVALKHAQRLGVADQVHGLAADMLTADLGGPYDLVLIANVLHHFSAGRAEELLHRAAAATKPGGKIAVVGYVMDENRSPAADPQAHIFALLMLVWTAEGDVHTLNTYRLMFGSAGYEDFTTHAVSGLPVHIMVGTRGDGQAA